MQAPALPVAFAFQSLDLSSPWLQSESSRITYTSLPPKPWVPLDDAQNAVQILRLALPFTIHSQATFWDLPLSLPPPPEAGGSWLPSLTKLFSVPVPLPLFAHVSVPSWQNHWLL